MYSEFIEKDLKNFDGYATVRELKESCQRITTSPGIYVVFREITGEIPNFLVVGCGGKHKGVDINYPISALTDKWIEGEHIIYIGKTDSSLRGRIRTYMNHGKGKDASHRGGRAIWQLPDSDNLIVAWKSLPANISARIVEAELIRQFKQGHDNRYPFANWQD